jgi:hypothetical protein
MVRNERVKYTENYDAMISENRDILKLDGNEVKQFLSLKKITEKMQIRNSIEYWKSSPYLLSFMENNYKLKEKMNYFIEEDMFSELDTEIEALSLNNEDIEEYKKIDPANARLRFILSKTIKRGGWKLIWIPPSLPYYKSTGVYSEEHLEDFSKDLVFSAWKVVPRVISSVLSYAAERKMVKNYDEHPQYSIERQNRSTLLNFNISDNNYKGMPVLNLIYPFEYFATEINPLEISVNLYDGELANMWDIIEKVKINIKNRLEKLVENIEIEASSNIDERWYWLAPLILEENHLKVREDRSFFEDIKAI